MIEQHNLKFRLHGQPPYAIAVIHGGPGAAGDMAPVAERLSTARGILEPFQTECSVEGQIGELKLVIEKHASLPATLIGYSWGAWLSCLLAAHHPHLVKKLILVSSAPFDARDTQSTEQTRISRFTPAERNEFYSLKKELQKPSPAHSPKILARLGALCAKADSFAPIGAGNVASSHLSIDATIYKKVWPEAANLRKNGSLLRAMQKIICPITAIHGDYDPHPAAGVETPLAKITPEFRFVLLPQCGHTPWLERHAEQPFYQTLENELNLQSK